MIASQLHKLINKTEQVVETDPSKMIRMSVLVVDDEANIRKTLTFCLEAEGHAVKGVSNPQDALDEASRNFFDLAFVDLRLGLMSGLDLIPKLILANPGIKIIVVTAFASLESAVEAVKRGAFDYLPKPFTPPQINLVVKKASELRRMEARLFELQQLPQVQELDGDFSSKSVVMQKSYALARQASESGATVLLRGETGTGKGFLARAMHAWSARRERPFVVVSCPSLPSDLLESELFGHAAGAFTGANKDFAGRVAQAQGGTLFLDEIGDLPLKLQPKLLRFLQDKEYERLGESAVRRADVRLIAATNVDLRQAVKDKTFREDLFYRLNVIEIEIPPLRKRTEDIRTLSEMMLQHFGEKNHHELNGFDEVAAQALQDYGWPGNLRELRNAAERAAILCPAGMVGLNYFPAIFHSVVHTIQLGDKVSVEKIEESHIRRILAIAKSMAEAAEILGMDVVTLWRKRKKYEI